MHEHVIDDRRSIYVILHFPIKMNRRGTSKYAQGNVSKDHAWCRACDYQYPLLSKVYLQPCE